MGLFVWRCRYPDVKAEGSAGVGKVGGGGGEEGVEEGKGR